MSEFRMIVVDPRPFALTGVLDGLSQYPSTLGVEVTVPAIAAVMTAGNIDPQHTGGNAAIAAIEAAVSWPLPAAGTALVTVRPDADAFGAMAVLALREDGEPMNADILSRVQVIANDDKTGAEWTPQDAVDDVSVMQALKAACFRNDIPVRDRVTVVYEYLLTGTFQGIERVRESVIAERREFLSVSQDIDVQDGIAVVESMSRFAVAAAYLVADVVVAVNPEFRFQGGRAHRKVTVCQARPGLVDLRRVWADLSELEAGWGGSPMVGGSPQGVSSLLGVEMILERVRGAMS